MELLKVCSQSRSELKPVWECLQLSVTDATIQKRNEFVNEAFQLLMSYKDVAMYFYPTSRVTRTIATTEQQWKEWTLLKISHFLYEKSPLTSSNASKYETLPLDFIRSFVWLQRLAKSDLFKVYWDAQRVTDDDDMERLHPASLAWQALWNSLKDGTTTFDELTVAAPSLTQPSEWSAFFETASGYKPGKPAGTWDLTPATAASAHQWATENHTTNLPNWLHLEQIYLNIEDIIRATQALGAFVEPSGLDSVDAILNTLKSLASKFRQAKWPQRQFKELAAFVKESSQIDARLIRFSGRLAVQLKDSMELFEWLRTMKNDSDFSNTIEVAQNRSEMECPPELWEEGEGRIGRPDEQKLAQLSTTRAYFRDIIFRPNEFVPNLTSLLEVIGLPAFDRDSQPLERAMGCLAVTNDLRLPLMELLAVDSENSATDRLLQLQTPQRKAFFTIKFDAANLKQSDRGTTGLQFLLVSPHHNPLKTLTNYITQSLLLHHVHSVMVNSCSCSCSCSYQFTMV